MDKKSEFQKLVACREDGTFHHATIRNLDRCYGGLCFYVKDDNGFRGYTIGGIVNKLDPDFNAAIDAVKGTGISIGAYGCG